MLLFDLRPLADPHPTGVHGVTRELARAVAALLPPGEFMGVANAAGAAARGRIARQAPAPTRIRRFPNKLIHAGMRIAGWPTLEALAGIDGPATIVSDPHFIAVRPDSTLIVVIHDLSFFREPAFFSRYNRLWHRAVGFPRLLARADRVVAVSEHTRRDLIDLFALPPEKVAVIRPGLPPEAFVTPAAAARDALRARFKLPRDYALMLGGGGRKNLDGALAGLAGTRGIPDLALVVAGAEDPMQLAAQARRTHPGGRLHAVGHLSEKDRHVLLSGARVLLYPSLYEGFGLPPLEAMALGVPVVAAHASSLGEVAGDCALLVDPQDATALACALERVFLEPAATAARAGRGLARAGLFRWENAGAQLLAVAAAARHAPLRGVTRGAVVHYAHADRH